MQTLSQYLIQLKNSGIDLSIVYDIGANNGSWSQLIKSESLADSQFYLFEANANHSYALSNTGFNFKIATLGMQDFKSVKFYSSYGSDGPANQGTGDGYYRENSIYFESPKITNHTTYTLDFMIQELGWPKPKLMKMDTQGSELDIMMGSIDIVSSLNVLVLELSLLNSNFGSPKISDYMTFLSKLGLLPFQVSEVHHDGLILTQLDIIFLNKNIFTDVIKMKSSEVLKYCL